MELSTKFPKCQSYPPVPNWYSSNVTAIVEPHFFLYATRQTIVVLDLDQFRYFNSFTASREKINAIAAHESFCFTAGVDSRIRVWNIYSSTLLATFHNHKAEITALKLIRNGTISISGDKSGKVVVTNPFEQPHTATQAKVKSEIACISTTVVDGKDYAAIGYANGMIFIEEIGQDLSMTTVFQISEDNDPIQSLDWQKHSWQSNTWPLLASTSKRKKGISVWMFPSQTKFSFVKLPPPPPYITDQQKAAVFVELSWSPKDHTKLYFSSFAGFIHCFDIKSRNPKNCKELKLERHNRNVFTINWFNQGKNCITTSMDQRVIKWDVLKKTCLQTMKTQIGFPYSLDTPSWNEGQVAVGLGDNSIKVWNFSNMAAVMKKKGAYDYYTSTVFWKGLQGKIEKIKWHPTREGLIAYGNEYGHVGTVDTFNNVSIHFKSYHRAPGAPFIDWGGNLGSILDEPSMTDTLLSVGGDGIIHVYDINNPAEPPVNLNDRLRERNSAWFVAMEATDTKRNTLAVTDTHDLVAIGHTSGLVEVYDLRALKVIFATNSQSNCIWSLDWKNIDGKTFLASGCEKGTIAIYDLSTIDTANCPDVPVVQNAPLCTLNGHRQGISDMKWSRDTDKLLLASGSTDSFVIVWDVVHQTPTALFSNHRAKVLSICWSQVDKTVLFSSSGDRFIYEWSYMDYICTQETVKCQVALYDRELDVLGRENKRKAVETFDAPVKKQKAPKKPNANSVSVASTSLQVSQSSEESTDRMQRQRYCLQLANKILKGQVETAIQKMKQTYLLKTQLQDATIAGYTDIFTSNASPQGQHENIHDLLYGDKNDIRRLVELEVSAIEQQDKSAPGEVLINVQNNVKHSLDTKLALDIMQSQFQMFQETSFEDSTNICLTDWILLALSPMVGKQKWIDLMMKQAQKLETHKQYHLAASCYIACSRIYDAVELYRRHAMFREAIVLAKLRLPSNDPIVDTLFGDWAKELQKGTQYTLTAICYLLSNMPGSMINAIGALARGGEESALFCAACLSVASNEETQEQRIKLWLNKLNDRF